MRQSLTIDDIKDRLLAQIDTVVHRYAPPAPGSYTRQGLYFTLNPGRADRSVGSFAVHMGGPKAGRWNDYATGDHGDIIDLIRLALGCDAAQAIREARALLGLDHESPEVTRERERAAQDARRRRAAAEAAEAEARARAQSRAAALWLSAREGLRGTPAELYLRERRGIDLAVIGRQPGALRYHPAVTYADEVTDPETGEITDRYRRMPAMLAAIVRGGRIVACHRTYLALAPDGRWDKAPVPDAKKVLAPGWSGGCVRLSTGLGPRGGKASRLSECPPGSRVYIAEGIETGLSAVVLRPEARVVAAVSLSNMGAVELPANVAEVVLIADDGPAAHPQAAAALDRAVAAHAAAGRRVRLWRSDVPGEDLNDALRRVQREREEGAA
ncbi:MAG TPA: toprim domain-containing protein [Paracoccaceae bacterium]|nr:toprim domain-containing protein [Paracoccaceae bacterium]